MHSQGMSRTNPLTSHFVRYSSAGLFLRYTRGRLRFLLSRIVFAVLLSCILTIFLAPHLALLGFLAFALGEAVDTLYLMRARRLLEADSSLDDQVRLFSTLTAAFDAVLLAMLSAMPVWIAHVAPQHSSFSGGTGELFTLAMLVTVSMNTAFLVPFHRSATIARLTILLAVPLLLFLLDLALIGMTSDEIKLHVTGLVMLYVAVGWLLVFLTRSFARTRASQEAQASQQQELKNAYQKLYEQQAEAQRLALVAQHANDSVMLMNPKGQIEWVNDAFTRITGYALDEVEGHEIGEFLNHRDTDRRAIQTIVEGRQQKKAFRVEILNRNKAGKDIWLETNQVPMLDSAGEVTHFIAIERDISEAKRNEQELQRARIAAEEGARSKSEFLATMSHEIRTPMNGVIGMAQLMSETRLDEDQKLYTDTILTSARTLLALINDILDLSKLDAGEVQLNLTEFDLVAWFENTLRPLQAQADTKSLELVFGTEADVPRRVRADDRRMGQILTNLVGNAIKFTEQGQVRVTLEAEQTAPGQAELVLQVADTGIGIPSDMLVTIFERFSQADAAISRRFGGTGLGLAISRRIASAMNGAISVMSDPGIGSCFTVRLPVSLVEGSDETVPEAQHVQAVDGIDGLHILVAEDNSVNRLLVSKFLKNLPVCLGFAHNGEEAVEYVKQQRPDVILMDMSMPVMDGLEATREIRNLHIVQPRIIALTANAFDTDKDACIAAGMDEFLTKPISRERLMQALSNLDDLPGSQKAD